MVTTGLLGGERGSFARILASMTCPSCAAEVPAGARFCPSCGHALHTTADERRVVTVLFADIVGFTGLAETLDPEQVKHLVDRCFERLAADVTSFGGHVDKVVGDGLLALFGAPLAHEDDAERAVRAALRMQESIDELAVELATDLRMRIGVNTGEVLVGSLRAGGDYTAMGDVVNTASRLQTMARPGQVIVGPETRAASAETFRYEPLGELHARGREATVDAWEAVEALVEPGNRPRHLGIPLIGRDAELNLLTSAVQSAITHRRPLLLLITGEAGVGKSRLATELIKVTVGELGVRMLIGRNLPYGPTTVWWSVAEMVRSACGITDDDAGGARSKCIEAVAAAIEASEDDADTLRVSDGLLYLMGIESRLTDVDPGRAWEEAVNAARAFFHGMAEHQPMLLIFGDAQWADDHVLNLVERLLDDVGRIPLVVLLTGRPELTERWRPNVEGANQVEVTLDPLGDSAAGELLVAILGRDPGPTLRREMLNRAGGNALFLEEMAALLKEGGELPALSFGSLPANLRGLVAARLDALPHEERAVLDDLAVLGRRGAIAALVALGEARTDAASVQRALRELAGKNLVEVDEETCGFISDLIREVAYNTLARAERAKRHVLLATWLEDEASRRDRVDEFLEEIAFHRASAAELAAALGELDGVPENVHEIALVALQRAAQRADDREMHRASKRLFGRMVGLLGDDVGSALRHALIGRARATTALRENDEAAADLDIVEREALKAGDDVALARALVVRGDLFRNLGLLDESIEVLKRATALWREIGDRRGEASALRRIGWTHVYAGDLDRAEPPILEALAAFRAVKAPQGIAWALQNLAQISFQRGQMVLAEERLRDSRQLFVEIGDRAGELWASGLLAIVWHTQGNTDAAEELAERILGEGSLEGDASASATMQLVLGLIRLRQGRVLSGAEMLRKAHDAFWVGGDFYRVARAVGPLAQALRRSGRIDEAGAVVTGAAALAESLPATSVDRLIPTLIATEHRVELGQPEPIDAAEIDTVAIIGPARDHEQSRMPMGYIAGHEEVRGLALAELGRVDEAVALLHAGDTERTAVLATRALVLAAAGRPEEARATIDVVRGLGGSTYHDLVLADLAEAVVASSGGDRDGLRASLRHADRLLDGTDDRLTGAIVGLARTELLGDPDGAEGISKLGIRADGWRTLLGAAGVRRLSHPGTPAS
jgi:class 3 adenylate cyclase/tetratricopeptide (TPR) repeat protein